MVFHRKNRRAGPTLSTNRTRPAGRDARPERVALVCVTNAQPKAPEKAHGQSIGSCSTAKPNLCHGQTWQSVSWKIDRQSKISIKPLLHQHCLHADPCQRAPSLQQARHSAIQSRSSAASRLQAQIGPCARHRGQDNPGVCHRATLERNALWMMVARSEKRLDGCRSCRRK